MVQSQALRKIFKPVLLVLFVTSLKIALWRIQMKEAKL